MNNILNSLREALHLAEDWTSKRRALRIEFLRRKKGFGKRRKAGFIVKLSAKLYTEELALDTAFVSAVKELESKARLNILQHLIGTDKAIGALPWETVKECSSRIGAFQVSYSSWDRFIGLRPLYDANRFVPIKR